MGNFIPLISLLMILFLAYCVIYFAVRNAIRDSKEETTNTKAY